MVDMMDKKLEAHAMSTNKSLETHAKSLEAIQLGMENLMDLFSKSFVSSSSTKADEEETVEEEIKFQFTTEQHAKVRPDRKSKNRKTYFETNFSYPENGAVEKPKVVMNVQVPSPDHIYLRNLEVSQFPTFLVAKRDFEQIHNVVLPPTKVLSKTVLQQLAYDSDVTPTEFNEKSPMELATALMNSVKVVSVPHFAVCLNESLSKIPVLEWDGVSPKSHEKFWNGVLYRKERFLAYFSIIFEANKNLCPTVDNKDSGTASIFLSLFDKSYNDCVLMDIKPIKSANYSTITEFVETYVAKASEHYLVAKGVAKVPYIGDSFIKHPSAVLKGKVRKAFNPSFQKPVSDTANKPKFEGYNKSSTSSYGKPNQRLNHIPDPEDENDDYYFQPHAQDNIAEETDYYSCDEDHGEEMDDVDTDVKDAKINAIGDTKHEPYGCVNYTLYGKCFKGNDCKFASMHNAAGAARTHKFILARLKSQNLQA